MPTNWTSKTTIKEFFIEPDMAKFVFEGEVSIKYSKSFIGFQLIILRVDILEENKTIQLNGKDLEVDGAFISDGHKYII